MWRSALATTRALSANRPTESAVLRPMVTRRGAGSTALTALRACQVLVAVALAWAAPVPVGASGHGENDGVGAEGRAGASWADRGVKLSFGYVGEWLHAFGGGTRRANAYADQVKIGADLDFEKLFGWRGASLHVVVTNRNGPQLDAEAGLGTLLETHEIFGRGHYTRLTRFYLEQALFDGTLLLKAGRGDVDFFPFTCDFINIGFCGALPGYHSRGWYTWPIGQDFANLTFRATDALYFKLGANEVNPRNLDGDQGLRLTTPDDDYDGTLTNLEVGWTPTFGGRLAGAYRVGYWRDSTDYPDLLVNRQGQSLPSAGGAPRMQDTSKGHYLMLRQQITSHGRERGLSLFANLSRSETNVSEVDRLISVGFWYTGPFESRPRDRIGLAFGQSRVGRRVNELERVSSALEGRASTDRGSEKPMELNYSFPVMRGFWLMPSLQYVRDPGGRRDAASARIFGLKILVDL
jgi:porin